MQATDEDRRVAEEIAAYWVAFARTGAPAPDGLAPWPSYDARVDERMTFGVVGPRMQPVSRAVALDAITKASDGVFK